MEALFSAINMEENFNLNVNLVINDKEENIAKIEIKALDNLVKVYNVEVEDWHTKRFACHHNQESRLMQ